MYLSSSQWNDLMRFFPAKIWGTIQTIIGLIKGEIRDKTTHTGAGAVPITHEYVECSTGGAEAWTLADGVDGQEIYLFYHTHVGNGTLTPANLSNATTITFTAAFQTAHLYFDGTDWNVLSFEGATVA